MISIISIYFGGILTLAMMVFHTRFYRIFKWKEDFEKIASINRKIVITIHIFLTAQFLILGLFSLIYAVELSKCIGLSFGFNLLVSLFWLFRTIWQIIYFKGKAMHYILILYFFLLFVSYFVPVAVKIL